MEKGDCHTLFFLHCLLCFFSVRYLSIHSHIYMPFLDICMIFFLIAYCNACTFVTGVIKEYRQPHLHLFYLPVSDICELNGSGWWSRLIFIIAYCNTFVTGIILKYRQPHLFQTYASWMEVGDVHALIFSLPIVYNPFVTSFLEILTSALNFMFYLRVSDIGEPNGSGQWTERQ